MVDPGVRKFAEGPNFAVLTTLDARGAPTTQVMWVGCDDDHILMNTETGRAKFRRLQRDPRVSLSIIDRDNPYSYAEVRGRVVETVRGPEAREHIDSLSQKYQGKPYDDALIETERVILKILPERQRA